MVALTVLGAPAPTATATADEGRPAAGQQARLRDAIASLPVANETRSGYDRDKFVHWIDADGDCQDTRDEVLVAESRVDTDGGCNVTTGEWFSYYDRMTWTDDLDVDIDHLVALAEAWDSGAKRWTGGTRKRFANDLGDARALVAVTDDVNATKSDQDPADWLPAFGQCRYLGSWVAIKLRWRLAVDATERQALLDRAASCADVVLRWRTARVVLRDGDGGGGGTVPRGLTITKILFNPDGDETCCPNQEYVAIANGTRRRKNLEGLRLSDTGGHRYVLPRYVLRPGRTVLVHGGTGVTRRGHLYAGWGVVWNNDGDTATLRTASGTTVDRCRYGDVAGSFVRC